MWDVFRFAWFAVCTFFGVCGLILALYAALWVFVKVHSTMAGNSDPDAVRQRVMLYSAQGLPRGDRGQYWSPRPMGANAAALGSR